MSQLIRVRSPFVKEVAGTYGSTQTGTKIILTIWNQGFSEPTSGQRGYYSLSKLAASPTQKSGRWNVSNYVKEFIDNIAPASDFFDYPIEFGDENEEVYEYCNFRIKAYWTATAGDTLISNELFVGVNGYTGYLEGVNSLRFYPAATSPYITMLTDTTIQKRIKSSDVTNQFNVNYVDVYIDLSGSATSGKVFYKTTISGTPVSYDFPITSGMKRVPLFITNAVSDTHPTTVEIKIYDVSNAVLVTRSFTTLQIDECKYEPVKCQFINRYGGWEFLYFFKAQKSSISSTGTDFKLTPQDYNYNTLKGQIKTFNINGKKTIKLNTGWVDENYSELIQDLLLSEKVLLDYKPVLVKTQGSDLKTYIQNKNINYEIEFEYAYDLINNVV
jgi:hypothetical protein